MSKAPTFQASQFIEAIPGTHGIVSAIAKRVGCNWNTAKKFIDEYPTVKAAFEAERESLLDIAESVVANNIKLALKQQQAGAGLADSQDAKWVLSRLGKARGYAEKQEISLLVEKELEKALNTLEKKLPTDVYNIIIDALAGEDSP